jgi:ubiquinone/menaquinone biosynthesis C-methylase UbiE
MFAQAGARHVLGVDGRRLAIERGRFAASVLEVSNIEFRQDDVRKLHALEDASFDIVLCSGILHHIEPQEWFPFLKRVARMTADTAIFYTHVADEQLRTEHKLTPAQLTSPAIPSSSTRGLARFLINAVLSRRSGKLIGGYLYREHRDDASAEERSSKMRASLDNTHSFWPTEETLVAALRKCGFDLVFKVQHPHMFRARWLRNTRQIIVARKGG